MGRSSNIDSPQGFTYALAAYLSWGLLPIYMKALAHIPPSEVIAHRVLWSIPIAGLVLWITRRTGDLKIALRSPRMLGMAVVTACLISLNWGIYVWSIANGHALDAALGYYINPLFSVFLGAVLLKERLSRLQIAAVALAAAAVLILTVTSGQVPLVALGLTLIYGVLHIINFAHGALLMVALYAVYWLKTAWGVDPYLALPLVVPRHLCRRASTVDAPTLRRRQRRDRRRRRSRTCSRHHAADGAA